MFEMKTISKMKILGFNHNPRSSKQANYFESRNINENSKIWKIVPSTLFHQKIRGN